MNDNYYLLKMFVLSIFMLPAFINAQVSQQSVRVSPASMQFNEGNQPSVANFFQEYRKSYPLSEDNKMEELTSASDKAGKHYRYDQYYKGVQVFGAQYVLHEQNSTVNFANGRIIHGLDLNVTPSISEQKALSAALKDVNAQIYMWENAENEAFIKKEQNNQSASFAPHGELILTSGNEELTAENIRLAYRFDVYAEQPLGRYWVDVDAKTGEIVNKISRIHTGDVPGSGDSYYDGNVSMTVDDVGGAGTLFTLNEATARGAAINTYNMNNGTDYGAATQFTSTTADGPWDGVGVNGHWGAEATYDYYFNKHSRNSLDDAGFALNSYVHRGVNYNNAFWDGSRMTYGDGDGVRFNPLVGLDVVAHELTHGVTNFSSDLFYYNESGGLNESFSDIFGNLVEFEMLGAPPSGGSWRIGEQITTDGLGIRNMENPNEFNNPDCYLGDYWFYYEVHNQSGVQNFWFYLLVEGGVSTNDLGYNYNVTGIGLDDAAAIAYHNNTSYLFPSATYSDARIGSIACAESLFGVGSQQVISTIEAWNAVGVYQIENDDCADAIPLSCGSSVFGSTNGATLDPSAPDCTGSQTAPGVWYTVVGNGGNITASTCETEYGHDNQISVYTGDCVTGLTCIDGNDDFCSLYSKVTWATTAGTTYYILVHGFDGRTGNFKLDISTDVTPLISVTPEDFMFTVPVDGSDSDLLTITNDVLCSINLNWRITKGMVSPPANLITPPGEAENTGTSKNTVREKFYFVGENTMNDLASQETFNRYQIHDQLASIENVFYADKSELYNELSTIVGDNNKHLVDQIMSYIEISTTNSLGNGFGSSSTWTKYQSPSAPAKLISGNNGEHASDDGNMLTSVITSTTITHSASQSIINGNSVNCNYDQIHSDNSYWRSFVLNDFSISGSFDVTDVEIGLESVAAIWVDHTVTVNLYTTDATFPTGTLTPIGTATYSISNQSLTMINLPVSGTAPAGSELVVEIFTPSGFNLGESFFLGSNNLGETSPSYISAAKCGVTTPTTYEALGFPGVHVIMNVTGNTVDTDCPWLSISPSSGSTSAGSSDDVTVAIDATGLAPGTYECELNIVNNSDGLVTVPVTVIVEDPCEAPTVTTKDITLELDADGNASIVALDILEPTTFTNLTSTANWLGFVGFTEDEVFYGDVTAIGDVKSTIDAGADEITLQPNFNIYYPDNFDNPTLQGSTYIEEFGTLAGGASFSFTGNTTSNTLDPRYDAYAFIRIFNAAFEYLGEIRDPLVAGNAFAVQYNNTEPDAYILQYGFTVEGTSGAYEDEASLGNAIVQGMSLNIAPYSSCGLESVVISQTDFDCNNIGINEVTVTATDINGLVSTGTSEVTVEDNELPILTVISDPITLWPPNHKYETIDMSQLFVSVDDNCGNLSIDDVYITSVTSDEEEDAKGGGDGKTKDDIVINSDCNSVDLRKERSGKGNGRVYSIFLEVMDENGNINTAKAQVHVPHNNGGTAIDDGMAYQEECVDKSSFAAFSGDDIELTNYPNPFNGKTTISFTLIESDVTTLKVYDTFGKEVATLFDGMAESGQQYMVEFKRENLSKGIYVYHLQSGNNVSIVKKMILMK